MQSSAKPTLIHTITFCEKLLHQRLASAKGNFNLIMAHIYAKNQRQRTFPNSFDFLSFYCCKPFLHIFHIRHLIPLHSLSLLRTVFSSDHLPHYTLFVDFSGFATYLLYYPHACFSYFPSIYFSSSIFLTPRRFSKPAGTLHHHQTLLQYNPTEPEKLNIHKTKTCTLHI
jgi:hypothetical protein